MNELIEKALHQAGDHSNVKSVKRAAGGSINKSYFVETDNRKYFIKYHPDAPDRFFELEAKGLALIRETNSIAVPEVYTYSDESNNACLVMEWVEGAASADTDWKLGERIAAMHQTFGEKHGFEDDTFIGTLPQTNGLFSSWLDYYRDRRLLFQLQLGIDRGRVTGKRRDRMETLLDNLDKWIPGDADPSYLHGDLWGGNWLSGPGGEPYVIDPSFLYGDRHFELAFTEVFGGYSSDFYRAYQEHFPLSPDYEDIKPLYQLYYLLVHLNMFGEAYGRSVDTILKRYAG
ncbi:fructosamine kinase family protein [Lentibacillus amyloliquefaciens]|uniref:Fructosamine kinase n=1 Tax=Lentibacillus amyloliquefaciens TaxID=1472767 RepID=A0A0U4F6K3_9BACI|nr:fructosamine kinase family protein [Lentibacillus amyloliquefaciens]ALX49222.1 fructosamine kinase [Lentibacillus amyloliquefaciens]